MTFIRLLNYYLFLLFTFLGWLLVRHIIIIRVRLLHSFEDSSFFPNNFYLLCSRLFVLDIQLFIIILNFHHILLLLLIISNCFLIALCFNLLFLMQYLILSLTNYLLLLNLMIVLMNHVLFLYLFILSNHCLLYCLGLRRLKKHLIFLFCFGFLVLNLRVAAAEF